MTTMAAFEETGRAPRTRALLEIHLAVFLFGFPGLFGKWLVLSPFLIVLGRVLFAALALALLLAVRRQSFRISPGRDMALLFVCGLVLAVHWTMFFRSVQVSTVAVGLLSYSTFPVFTAFLEPLAARERWDPRSLAFSLVVLGGVFLIVPEFEAGNTVFRGVLWGLGAGLTFSVLAVLNRRLAQRHSSLAVAFYEDLYAAVGLLPALFLLPFRPDPGTLGLLALLGVVGTAAAHALFIKGMRHVPARTASILGALEPVYGIALAWILLNESPSPRTLAGGALILAAALVVTAKARRPS
jgi:drug/metabolite transporter (DMT)-like permease